MVLKKKNRYKPFYKQFLFLKEFIQNQRKIYSFKKKKWKYFQKNLKKKYSFRRLFKLKDQKQNLISFFFSRPMKYKGYYKFNKIITKKFRLLYGDLRHKYFKKQLQQKNIFLFLNHFERRLDNVLYRAKFCLSVKSARQLIQHKNVLVNGKVVFTKSYAVKHGDIITIVQKVWPRIISNLKSIAYWPLPPKHFIINYKTFQIYYGFWENKNLSSNFPFHLNIEKIITSKWNR